MTGFKLYWARFKSETPRALKKLRRLALSISAAFSTASGALMLYEKTAALAITLGIIAGVAAGIAAGCTFATTDESLQQNS